MTALAIVAEFDDVAGDPAYALAARQGERFARLFTTGQIAVRLIHAVSRPAVQPMEET